MNPDPTPILNPTPIFSPLGQWPEHATQQKPKQYGHLNSYHLAAGFLDGLPLVEDWGCGSGFARRFFTRSRYLGIDGTKSPWCDVVDNLATRLASPDGLLLRHVLEHNPEWEKVLENALNHFRRRMVIAVHTPLDPTKDTYLIGTEPTTGIPSYALSYDVLQSHLLRFSYTQLSVPGTEEVVFFVYNY